MLADALVLAEAGFSVLPLEPGGKRPHGGLVRHGVHQATTDESVVRGWWGVVSTANIGVRTGQGLVALDVDGALGADGLAELEREHWEIPCTVRAVTPNGAHYLFSSVTPVHCSVSHLAPGLDVRGEGGYIVVAPSRGPSGRRYEWVLAPGEAPVAPMPDWIGRLLAPISPREAKPATRWREIVRGVAQGRRNATAARLCGHLLGKGVDPHVTLELVMAWDAQRNLPPLGPAEIIKVCESIAARELRTRGHRVST